MRTFKSAILMAITLIAFALIMIPVDCRAQLKKMSAEDLTKESSAILYGKCSKVKSEWNKDRDLIFTTVTVIPDEYIKGDLGTEAKLTIPGGQVDDIIYEVSEMPVFNEGEEIFAFVWKHPSGKNLVTGGTQGKLKIEKDKNTGKKIIKGLVVKDHMNSTKKGVLTDATKTTDLMLLEDFTNEVRGYLK